MLRCTFSAIRAIGPLATTCNKAARIICNDVKSYTTFKNVQVCQNATPLTLGSLSNNRQILAISNSITATPARTVTKFSRNKGKRKTCKAVIKRFLRLHWGGWIRTKVGKQKRLWKKSPPQKRRLKQHVFCNASQTTLLDKMVTKFWKRPKYYVDDPYAPYHTREEFYITRKRPLQRP